MSNATTFVKLVAMMGLIVVLTTTLTGSGNSQWAALESSVSAGIDWPEFWNPFTQETVRRTAFADYPVGEYDLFGDGTVYWSGCADDGFNRSRCLAEQDGDESYVQINMTTAAPIGIFGASFNLSNPQFLEIDEADFRAVVITIQCKTVSEGTSVMAFYASYLQGGIFALSGFCPKDRYDNVVLRDEFPVGTTDPDPPFSGNPQAFILSGYVPDMTSGIGFNRGLVQARFSYFRIDIEFVSTATCEAPEGAWFPWIDNVACSIGQFASIVWKGIQLFGSAVAFILITAGVLLVFIGNIVANLILGLVEVSGSLFNLGAPSPAQEIIDVLVIAVIAFILFTLIALIRGTEG